MNDDLPSPEKCVRFSDALEGIDVIDRKLLELLSMRFSFVRVAAGLNEDRIDLDDEEVRKRSLSAIRRRAFELEVPVGLVGDFWERLFEISAALERQARHQGLV